jgi:hypothetical protein
MLEGSLGKKATKGEAGQKTLVWLTFDLGFGRDIEPMYVWLDGKDAQECGPYTAVLKVDGTGDVFEELRAEIAKSVDVPKRARIYAVYHDGDRARGRFLFGSRKDAPWRGYAAVGGVIEDVA